MARNHVACAQVLVVHACAFDSVPADLGVAFTSKLFARPAAVASIESFLTMKTGQRGMHGHITTYQAAVHGFGSARDLSRVRRGAPFLTGCEAVRGGRR
jgi:short subunit dehydrogenase-like uncharacterized protein